MQHIEYPFRRVAFSLRNSVLDAFYECLQF